MCCVKQIKDYLRKFLITIFFISGCLRNKSMMMASKMYIQNNCMFIVSEPLKQQKISLLNDIESVEQIKTLIICNVKVVGLIYILF